MGYILNCHSNFTIPLIFQLPDWLILLLYLICKWTNQNQLWYGAPPSLGSMGTHSRDRQTISALLLVKMNLPTQLQKKRKNINVLSPSLPTLRVILALGYHIS